MTLNDHVKQTKTTVSIALFSAQITQHTYEAFLLTIHNSNEHHFVLFPYYAQKMDTCCTSAYARYIRSLCFRGLQRCQFDWRRTVQSHSLPHQGMSGGKAPAIAENQGSFEKPSSLETFTISQLHFSKPFTTKINT